MPIERNVSGGSAVTAAKTVTTDGLPPPDLVLGSGDGPSDLIDDLERLGVPGASLSGERRFDVTVPPIR
jgi:hypothetical protein